MQDRWLALTHVHQKGQTRHSLHREDEEGDQGKEATLGFPLNLLQGLFKGTVCGSRTGQEKNHHVRSVKAYLV